METMKEIFIVVIVGLVVLSFIIDKIILLAILAIIMLLLGIKLISR
jgi:hypothetical protein